MKCLTLAETKEWCSTFNVGIDLNQNLSFPWKVKSVIAVLPQKSGLLMSFSSRLTDWLPRNSNRMLYLSYWDTYPPNQNIIYEKLHYSCGETRHIIDSPGHLFDPLPEGNIWEIDKIPNLASNPIFQESAVMWGLIFLILTFEWHGYLVSEGHSDHIYLGDAFIVFKSESDEKLNEARTLLAQFKLKIIDRMEDAWTKE